MGLIMVLDDEQDSCRLIQRVLYGSGHEVQTFTDGNEALHWLESHEPDLAILDIKLRRPDGIQILEHMRRRKCRAKVLMITGHPSVETAQRAFQHGIEDYMVKPIEIDELEERVNRALRLIL